MNCYYKYIEDKTFKDIFFNHEVLLLLEWIIINANLNRSIALALAHCAYAFADQIDKLVNMIPDLQTGKDMLTQRDAVYSDNRSADDCVAWQSLDVIDGAI